MPEPYEYTPAEEQVAEDVANLAIVAERYSAAAHAFMDADDIEDGDWDHPMVQELWHALGSLCVVSRTVSERYLTFREVPPDA